MVNYIIYYWSLFWEIYYIDKDFEKDLGNILKEIEEQNNLENKTGLDKDLGKKYYIKDNLKYIKGFYNNHYSCSFESFLSIYLFYKSYN